MSSATKKKHVAQEVLNQFELPNDDQQIVKVLSSRGNNLHEVLTPNGETYLVSMPPKFRKSIWIKRGNYLIVDPIEEGNKVKAEITQILLKDQIKYIKEEGKWPSAFDDKSDSSISGSDDEKLFKNTNRCQDFYESSSGSETDDEDCDEDQEEEEDHKSDSN